MSVITSVGVGMREGIVIGCIERQEVRQKQVALLIASQESVALVKDPAKTKFNF